MNRFILSIAILFSGHLFAQDLTREFPRSFTVKISNPVAVGRAHVIVVVPPAQLKKLVRQFNAKAFVVLDGTREIPSQYNQPGHDDAGIVFVLDTLTASATKTLTIRFHPTASIARDYPKRTQAELSHKVNGAWKGREYIGGTFQNVNFLRVPPEHKDHSWFLRYEGPGWESDKVGYRFYLDQRNATDVFGKKTPEVVLQQAGLDGFESYHHPQPWGMDVMKVNKSLGLGSPGILHNGQAVRIEKTDSVSCRITTNGVVYSSILTTYSGWQVADNKYDVQSTISIHQGTRLSHQRMKMSRIPENFCTGIVKDKAAAVVTKAGDAQHWGYIATYGKQSLNDDNLGLAVFFNASDATGFGEDTFSHLVKFKAKGTSLEYYFLAAWEGEPGGIRTETEFYEYLNQLAAVLAAPVRVDVLK